MAEKKTVPLCYTLTRLTRDASAERRAIVAGFDVQYRHVIIFAIALVLALPLIVLFWPLLGSAALIWPLITWGAIYMLWERRSSTGLRKRQVEAIRDRLRSREDVFYCRGMVVDPAMSRFGVLRTSWAPAVNIGDAPAVRPYPVLAEVKEGPKDADELFRHMYPDRVSA